MPTLETKRGCAGQLPLIRSISTDSGKCTPSTQFFHLHVRMEAMRKVLKAISRGRAGCRGVYGKVTG